MRSISIHDGHATRNALVAGLLVTTAIACRTDGRSRRTEQLLAELAPSLKLGQKLVDARRAIPALKVRHPGDPTDLAVPSDTDAPVAVAVLVSPGPQAHEHAAPDATIEGVEFVMTPDVATSMRRHVEEVFHERGEYECAGRSISVTDSVVVWELGRRGGVVLTFPERRPEGEPAVSRMFVYSGTWSPSRSLSGYGVQPCSVPSSA
jgi:hypothetical protein